jgi:hypothetical protein
MNPRRLFSPVNSSNNASRLSSSVFFFSVMSRAIVDMPTTVPVASRIGATLIETSTRVPSFVSRSVSMSEVSLPLSTRSHRSLNSCMCVCGMMIEIGLPFASS